MFGARRVDASGADTSLSRWRGALDACGRLRRGGAWNGDAGLVGLDHPDPADFCARVVAVAGNRLLRARAAPPTGVRHRALDFGSGQRALRVATADARLLAGHRRDEPASVLRLLGRGFLGLSSPRRAAQVDAAPGLCSARDGAPRLAKFRHAARVLGGSACTVGKRCGFFFAARRTDGELAGRPFVSALPRSLSGAVRVDARARLCGQVRRGAGEFSARLGGAFVHGSAVGAQSQTR